MWFRMGFMILYVVRLEFGIWNLELVDGWVDFEENSD